MIDLLTILLPALALILAECVMLWAFNPEPRR